MDKTDHLMAEKNENNKDSQKGQVTPKKILKKQLEYKPLLTDRKNMLNFGNQSIPVRHGISGFSS
jgi:hypothetical protein